MDGLNRFKIKTYLHKTFTSCYPFFRENRYAFLRGGNWNNTSNAGAFALNLNNAPANANNNIGFRCASDQLTRQDGVVCVHGYIPSVLGSPSFLYSSPPAGENIMPVFLSLL